MPGRSSFGLARLSSVGRLDDAFTERYVLHGIAIRSGYFDSTGLGEAKLGFAAVKLVLAAVAAYEGRSVGLFLSHGLGGHSVDC